MLIAHARIHTPAFLLFSACLSKKCQNDTFVFIFPKLHECLMLMSTVRSLGHVGTVSHITTLFLGKPPYWGFGVNEMKSNLGKRLAKWWGHLRSVRVHGQPYLLPDARIVDVLVRVWWVPLCMFESRHRMRWGKNMLFSSSAFPHSVVETYNTFFHVRRNTGDIILLRQVHVITSFRQHASRKHQE